MRTLVGLLIAALIAIAGCGDEESDQPPGSDQGRERSETGGGQGRQGAGKLDFGKVETVAEGLEVPWAIAFVDRERILVTERPGRVRLVEKGQLQDEPAAEVDVSATGEGGLMGIALHPQFPDERIGFLFYTAGAENRISRFRVSRQLGFEDEEVIARTPAAAAHDGGRLGFGPDGRLYASTGDASEPSLADDRDSLAGKILRFEADGGPAGAAGFGTSPIFSFGHRNPQGFGWGDSGRMYAAEHGPSGELGLCCHDEINLVEAGKFYGWPYRAGQVAAAAGEPPQEPIDPILESGEETWAPAGLAVHEPEDGPISLLVGNLAAERLMRVEIAPESPRQVRDAGTALDGLGRIRAVALGPDGCVYLTTSNTDGRGNQRAGDDRLARVCS